VEELINPSTSQSIEITRGPIPASMPQIQHAFQSLYI
jgi:hypothetical protein